MNGIVNASTNNALNDLLSTLRPGAHYVHQAFTRQDSL